MSGGKLWRLIFTLLMTALLAIFGWFVAEAALDYVVSDSEIRSNFAQEWSRWLYRGAFMVASVFFGIAFGRFVFRKIEEVGSSLDKMGAKDKLALAGGLAIGFVLSAIVSIPVILTVSPRSLALSVVVSLLLGVVITYLTVSAGWSLKEEIRFYIPPKEADAPEPAPADERFKLLDTNVIIDGRVADVARAGFIEGHLYVPGFVLDELQHIADSADALKRARGRRGLDTLNEMREGLTLTVRDYDHLAPGKEAVDSRLVRLAKAMHGAIVTNDFNLNKVASLEGVQVLNINQLANCIKVVVLPGEEMNVTIVKHGKESGQGVGFLDDGTMVVVEEARRRIGETVPVLVQSVMQTQAGKMIFAHIADEDEPAHGDAEETAPTEDDAPRGTGGSYNNGNHGRNNAQSIRTDSGGGVRRPVRKP